MKNITLGTTIKALEFYVKTMKLSAHILANLAVWKLLAKTAMHNRLATAAWYMSADQYTAGLFIGMFTDTKAVVTKPSRSPFHFGLKCGQDMREESEQFLQGLCRDTGTNPELIRDFIITAYMPTCITSSRPAN